MVFEQFGTDVYWCYSGHEQYYIDLSFYGEGLLKCDCKNYEIKRESYNQRGIDDPCKHGRLLRHLLAQD